MYIGDYVKGFVFNIKGKNRVIPIPGIGRPRLSLRELTSRYGVQTFLVTLFFMGLIVGSVGSKGFDKELFDRLDFLFITNIEARLKMSAFEIFSSCFVSYFLFTFLLALFAFSAWGFAAAPLLSVFKGFSVGLSSAFLFASYGAAGLGFYILIVLPGAALYLFGFVRYSRASMRFSFAFARLAVSDSEQALTIRPIIKLFFKKSVYAFIYSGACAVLDMLLWVLFSDKFHFS